MKIFKKIVIISAIFTLFLGAKVFAEGTELIKPIIVSVSNVNGVLILNGGISSDKILTFTGTTNPKGDVAIGFSDSCGVLPENTGCAFGVLGSTVADEQGNWIIQSNPINDGIWKITAQSSNEMDTLSSEEFNLTIDTNAPEVPIIQKINNFNSEEPRSGYFDENNNFIGTGITNDNTIIFYGTAEVNAHIHIDFFSNDETNSYIGMCITKSDELGNFICDDSHNITPDGTYTALAIAQDLAGNNSIQPNPNKFIFTINTIPPEAPVITSPTSSPYSGNLSLEVSGTCDGKNKVVLTTETASASEPFKLGNSLGAGAYCVDGKFNITIESLETLNQANSTLDFPIKIAAVQIEPDGFDFTSPLSNIITISEPENITPTTTTTPDTTHTTTGSYIYGSIYNPIKTTPIVNAEEKIEVKKEETLPVKKEVITGSIQKKEVVEQKEDKKEDKNLLVAGVGFIFPNDKLQIVIPLWILLGILSAFLASRLIKATYRISSLS